MHARISEHQANTHICSAVMVYRMGDGGGAIEREDKRLHRWKLQTAIKLIGARRAENKIAR